MRGALFTRHRVVRPTRGERSPATQGAIQPCQRDPEIGERLRLGVLGLGEGELSVRELEDGAHPGVETALGQTEVLLGRLDGLRGGENALLGFDHRRARLLHLAGDVELGRLHARLGGVQGGA